MTKKPDKLRPDAAEIAFRVFQEAVGEAPKTDPTTKPKNAAAVERGAKGGKVGGKARADKLTPEQRSDVSKRASQARWDKRFDP